MDGAALSRLWLLSGVQYGAGAEGGIELKKRCLGLDPSSEDCQFI